VKLLAIVVVLAIAAPGGAAADPCTGTSSAGKFALCFDPGNRISITGGSDGLGLTVAFRHEIHFDDEPDLVWRLEHTFLDATHATLENRFVGTLYRGHFIRHARDGHIVIPLGRPKKVFLPFDVGAFAEVGRIQWTADSLVRLGIVRMAGLVDVARSRSFRTRLAIGPSSRWEVDIQRDMRALGDHHVAPFTTGMASLRLESSNGRLVGDLRAEAGMVWHSNGTGWKAQLGGEATVERIVLAINDRPIALSLGLRYASETDEALARVGARIVLAQGKDPRVSLH
jgi:hypothetical protein